MATLKTCYVRTDNTFNGNGTTSGAAASAGAVGAYNSVTNAFTGEATNLVTADRQLDINCGGTVNDAWSGSFNGTTTDATRYVRIFADPTYAHAGLWATNFFTFSNATDDGCIVLQNGSASGIWARIENCRIQSRANDPEKGTGISIRSGHVSKGEIRIIGCIIRYNPTGTVTTNNDCCGIMIDQAAAARKVYLINNIIYNFRSSGIFFGSIFAGEQFVAYNNTTSQNNLGSLRSAQFELDPAATTETVVIKNNIMTTFFTASTPSTYTHNNNGTTDTTSPDNTYDSQTYTYVSTTFASADYHLATADTGAREKGADLSADGTYAFSNDAAGVSRPQGALWDQGALEGAVIATLTPSMSMMMGIGL